jgi:methionyl-tRNA formyltransferase
MKRIIFMGTPAFGAYILQQLLEVEQQLFEVVAVISQPDKPVGRKRVLQQTPVKAVGQQYDLPVLQPAKIGDIYDELVALAPDLIITAAYGQIVPKKILDLPTDKCINVHGSLLPKYRGGAPIQHAIIDGQMETGITIMYMAEKMDAGAMLAQVAVPITQEDTQETMFEKLQVIGAKLLIDMLPRFFNREIDAEAQNEDDVTYAPTIKKDDCKIDWTKGALMIFNQVRGLYPRPAAFTTLHGEQIKVYAVAVVAGAPTTRPGTIMKVEKEAVHVATGDGVIALEDIQLSGKKRQSIAEFMGGTGRKLFVEGVTFED